MLFYDLAEDRILGARRQTSRSAARIGELEEIAISAEKGRGWRVEADFIEAIRGGEPILFTDFESGVAYMEFTEAVALSAERSEPIDLPLAKFTK